MNEHDAVEAAFNNGYEKGYADGKAKVMSKNAFPRFLVRQPELSKKDVEDILMQSPTIIMDKNEIIPIYPYRWIPVTERLPERFVYVLAMTDFGEAAVARLKGNGRWYIGWDNDQYDGVTHWMPIPEPPKGE